MGHGNARHGRQATPLAHNLSRAALGPVSVPSVARGSGLAVAIMINIPGWRSRPVGERGQLILAKVHALLAALAQEVLAEDPFFGAVNVYRAKCSDRQKILVCGYQRACRQAASQPRRTARRSPAAGSR